MGGKKAFISGITGQDGAYLAKFLLEKGYQVYGGYRRTSTLNFWRINELGISKHPRLHLVSFELTDGLNIHRLFETIQPDEVYNLAAQSFVEISFSQPSATTNINALGTLNMLEAIRSKPHIRFYQASTSEMFGKVQTIPQNEETPFYPRSPYGTAKLCAHWLTINYRESYDLFACCGILFNHESPLRGLDFVTRKITDAIARIKCGQLDYFELGNLNAERDWGHAEDFVKGMWLMLQAEQPDDYVLATGEKYSIRDFLKLAFDAAGIEPVFSGSGYDEIVTDKKTGKVLVRINPKLYRPAEVDLLIGDATKAKKQLGWSPEVEVPSLCKMMLEADLQRWRIQEPSLIVES